MTDSSSSLAPCVGRPINTPSRWAWAGVICLALVTTPACDDEDPGRIDVVMPPDLADGSALPDGVDGTEDVRSDADSQVDLSTDDTAAPDQSVDLQPDQDIPSQGPRERECNTTFRYVGAATSVHVAGNFNAWSETMTPLAQSGGTWSTEVNLAPGSHAYKFIIDGVWEDQVPRDGYTQWENDIENRSVWVGDCSLPMWETVAVSSQAGAIDGRIRFVRAAGGAPLDVGTVQLTVGEQSVTPTVDSATDELSFTFNAPSTGKYSIRLSGQDTSGNPAENNTFYVPHWVEDTPFTWQDATLYLIFTDRFRDSDGVDQRISGVEERANYLGGDFKGITDAIEMGYFASLGVNAIWLSPMYDNPEIGYRDKRDDTKLMSGFHGYWPISLEPEPRYGDAGASAPDRLKELIDTAHDHGIRILFDLALNHVHESHTYCQENPSWCDSTCQCGDVGCGWDPSERGLDCQFDYFLPDLSYRNQDIVERVIADTFDLLDEYDIDGLRIDAARHMDHVIMTTLRMQIRDRIEANGGAPYYLVGETFTDDRGQIMDYVGDHELHGQFDFAMRSAIRFVLGPGNGPFTALDDAVAASASPSGYGDDVWWMSPFFGNHDIDRFATVIAQNDQGPWGDTVDLMASGDAVTVDQWDIINRMSMAFAFLLSYKGIPLLYYGDEIGLAGSQDPDNRRMYDWTYNANQSELLSRVQTLGQARRDLRPLRHGERRELWKDDTLYVFARGSGLGDTVIIAMNKGGARSESVTIPSELGIAGSTLQSYNSSRTLSVGATAQVELDPWEYALFY